MARPNTGGRSTRVDVALPNDLYAALQKWMKRHKVTRDSEAVRIAVAKLVGEPKLAQGVSPGRPKAERGNR